MKARLSRYMGVLALAAVLGFLYYKSTSVDAKQQVRVSSSLRQLHQLDELLGQYVLQARMHLLKNYDPIVQTQIHIHKLVAELGRKDMLFASEADLDLRNRFQLYVDAAKQKQTLLERFKSQNAVLHNSAQYFPQAIHGVLEERGHLPDGDPMEIEVRDHLMHDMLVYEVTPSASLQRAIHESMTKIAQGMDRYPAHQREQLAALLTHSAIMLAYQDEVERTIQELLNVRTGTYLEELFDLYSRQYEKEGLEADKYRFWLMLFAVSGLIYGFYSLIRISRAREALNQSLSELEFQKFALDQHSIVSITDRTGTILYTNDKFSEISQYSREELLGKDHRLLNSGYHPHEFFKEMWSTIGRGKVWHGEVLNRRKDGSGYWVDSTIVPFMDAQGKPLRYVSIRSDITARKEADARLQEQRAFYEHITETLGEGLYVQDSSGRCIYLNLEGENLLGWQRGEFIGMRVHDTIHSHTADGKPLPASECPIMINVVMEGRSHSDDQVFVRKDGSVFPVEVISQAIMRDGKVEGVVVAFRDISERKKYELSLHQAKEEAEAASRAKGDFLANMSHEIRTPMNGIIGMTELTLDTDLNTEQREYLSLVKSSANALMTIINDILDFSKIESGRLEIEPIEFSLEMMLRETMKTLALRAHQKQLELLVHIESDVPDRVLGDPGRLRQVIVNLVGNAIKFTEQGEIEVALSVEQGASDGHVRLRFAVRDTGIGIPQEKFRSVFESFSQADTSTTRKYGGTGLGLTISAQLVELMGGHIDLTSTLGQGSTFFFTLDLPVVSADPLLRYQRTGHLAGLPVLVVDDNATNRRLLQEMLGNWKLNPTVVENGVTALAELARANASGQPYGLALLDLQMPDMSGFELVEHIREHPEYAVKMTMMLTSEGQRGHAARCRDLGVASYLMKPVSQSELLDAIMTALGEVPAGGELITRHSLRELHHKLNLLLAEDNAVNQTLAIRLLEKMGHSVTLAVNGLEAIQKWQAGRFDAILMDVDMPEMNGYEATQHIRAEETTRGGHIPIVAMTAHAMQGEREECMRHGMDGYLNKPIDTEALWQELDRIGRELSPAAAIVVSAQDRELPVADMGKARQTMDDNRELFEEIVRLYFEDAPRYLQSARDALASGDAGALRHAAHTLKGMVGIFAAERTMQSAARLEQAITDADRADALAELEVDLHDLESLLRGYQW